jgi:hypothetical protein
MEYNPIVGRTNSTLHKTVAARGLLTCDLQVIELHDQLGA